MVWFDLINKWEIGISFSGYVRKNPRQNNPFFSVFKNMDGVNVVTFVSTLSTVASETNHWIERWGRWGGAIPRVQCRSKGFTGVFRLESRVRERSNGFRRQISMIRYSCARSEMWEDWFSGDCQVRRYNYTSIFELSAKRKWLEEKLSCWADPPTVGCSTSQWTEWLYWWILPR